MAVMVRRAAPEIRWRLSTSAALDAADTSSKAAEVDTNRSFFRIPKTERIEEEEVRT